MYKNKASIFKFSVVCLLALLFTVACDEDPVVDEPDNNDTKDKAEYDLGIFSSITALSESSHPDKSLIGDNVSSSWDSELGIIWLGTDEKYLPTGTLTIFIDSIVEQRASYSAILSTTDQLVGTSQELNAKLFNTVPNEELILEDLEIGANYVSGSIPAALLEEATTGELVWLTGSFTALSGN